MTGRGKPVLDREDGYLKTPKFGNRTLRYTIKTGESLRYEIFFLTVTKSVQ